MDVIPGRLEEPNPEFSLRSRFAMLRSSPGMTAHLYFTAWMRSQSALR